ncbi:MAG: hypothetical protein ABIL68_05555 [bacterium]
MKLTRRTAILSCIISIFSFVFSARADINLGLKLCNNRWTGHWLYTFAPELSISGRWFWIEIDGTMGTHAPLTENGGLVYQSRWSLIPMLRIPIFGPFFAAGGYGFCHTFRREDLLTGNGEYSLTSFKSNQGEIRGFIGVSVPISSSMRIYIKGGYSYINRDNRYYSVSVGTSLTWSGNSVSYKRDTRKPSVTEIRENNVTSDIQKITIVGSKDMLVDELNRSVELALMEAGFQVFQWDSVRDTVNQYYDAQKRAARMKNIDPSSILTSEPVNPMDIAIQGARFLKLDAIIDTGMRYAYKSYGGEVIIHSAHARIIHPQSGKVLWSTELDQKNIEFSSLKQRLSREIVRSLR